MSLSEEQTWQLWNNLPPEVQSIFGNVADKSDFTGFAWFEHLVPESLMDSPNEILSFMNGNPQLGVTDKDVSRIESGHNGGEYTPDNTVMEDMSVNRARGAENMTESEFTTAELQNEADAEVIETFFTDDNVVTTVVEESTNWFDIAGETFLEGLMPVIGAYKAGTYVADQCKSDQDKLGYGSLAAGGAALLLTNPFVAGFYGVYLLANTGYKVYNHCTSK